MTDRVDQQIIRRLQGEFPLVPAPYRRLADEIGITETELLERLQRMKAQGILRKMGAQNVGHPLYGGESSNLLGGTCRFGTDPTRSVLDADCRAHEVENLYVTDGSFLPSSGGVPFTFTIYANALRVADKIIARLGGRKTAAGAGK